MSYVLTELGYDYQSAWNGQEGVKRVLTEDFDLVLMDLRMPVMSGYEAVRKIRDIKKDLPIFALSADAINDISLKCKAMGFTGTFTKPIDIDHFKKWIQGLIPA